MTIIIETINVAENSLLVESQNLNGPWLKVDFFFTKHQWWIVIVEKQRNDTINTKLIKKQKNAEKFHWVKESHQPNLPTKQRKLIIKIPGNDTIKLLCENMMCEYTQLQWVIKSK